MAHRINRPTSDEPDIDDHTETLDELVESIISLDPKLTDLLVAIGEGTESKSKLIARIQSWNEGMGGCETEALEPVAAGENIPGWLG